MSRQRHHKVSQWRPSEELLVSGLYHPSISPEHPSFSLLSGEQQALVDATHRQYNRWSHKRYFKAGMPDRLIGAMNGFHFARKVCNCMMIKSKYSATGYYSRCNQDWFCVYCAYLRGQDLLKKYAGGWADGVWYELVLSLAEGICPVDPEHDPISVIYDTMVAALKTVKDRKLTEGYVAWLEIKVHSFYPRLVVTPHLHAVFRREGAPDVRAIEGCVADAWTTAQLATLPDLLIAPAKSEAHFYELLSYIKAIDVSGPYHSGYQRAQAVCDLPSFHQNVCDFYGAIDNETRMRKFYKNKKLCLKQLRRVTRERFFYGGCCHGSAKAKIGMPKGERCSKQHQNAIRLKVELANEAEEAALKQAELAERQVAPEVAPVVAPAPISPPPRETPAAARSMPASAPEPCRPRHRCPATAARASALPGQPSATPRRVKRKLKPP